MVAGEEKDVLSKVELILPANVVEACYNLERNVHAYFMAVNQQDRTSSEITLYKLKDDSVKIRVTGEPYCKYKSFITCTSNCHWLFMEIKRLRGHRFSNHNGTRDSEDIMTHPYFRATRASSCPRCTGAWELRMR